ncbi:MAG TPA: nitrate reductase molybdenum cofactor assembly chaperone [Micromonosporaceae bacterium]|nr:nitrate reductase molybdenum cofactor assembly chaperone [Micromonosporaceae bacterium]
MRPDPRHAWQAQSLLLGYPTEELLGHVPLLRRVAASAETRVGEPMSRFLDHLEATPLRRLASDYVSTFDQQKRCCLYLTYYAYGDTRKRGMALLNLKQTYAAAGLRLVDDELPDHLAVMLEYASGVDVQIGRDLLNTHRAGLELLRLALHDCEAAWAPVLDSISATLPVLRGDEREAVARLAAQGPPEEQVGLAPYPPPQLLPQPSGGRR